MNKLKNIQIARKLDFAFEGGYKIATRAQFTIERSAYSAKSNKTNPKISLYKGFCQASKTPPCQVSVGTKESGYCRQYVGDNDLLDVS